MAAYGRNDSSPFLRTWTPALREGAQDIRAAWQDVAARAIDAFQNSGFIAGIIDQSAAAVVGTGLTFSSQPDAHALGWTEEAADAWAEEVERWLFGWANTPRECDAGGRMTFGQMQDAAYKAWFLYGEILSLLPVFQRRPGGSFSKVMLLPPSRLARKTDGQHIVDGVRIDAFGCAFGYFIVVVDANGMRVEREIDAFDRDGRQKVVHVFAPGVQTYRGISPLAPVLKVVRQIDQFADATLTTALIQTIFAATVKSDLKNVGAFAGLMTGDEQDALDLERFIGARNAWYDSEKIDLSGHGRIAHLFPNETLEFHEAKHPSATYDSFMQWLLREVCLCAGLTYTAGTNDSRNATYSSVRMDTAINWGVVLRRRSHIVEPFCKQVLEAAMEDAIGSGQLRFPGGYDAFIRNKTAACMGQWNGPAQPQADDLKSARASETYIKLGVKSVSRVQEELGIDSDDELRKRAREKKKALAAGLPDPHAPADGSAEFSRDEQGDDEDKSDNPSFQPEPA